MIALNTLAIGAATLFAVAAADHSHQISRAHHHNPLAERSENHLQKRFSGTGTYYITGLGACGIYNNPSDKIVALNSAQFGGGYPGPNCFKMITICKGGNCHKAQITDECPTCDYGSLDLSQSLFEQFASTDDGVFPMTWSFADDSEPTTTKKPDPPKTTSTKEPEPTKTTKEPEPEPTTTSKEHTTTSKKHTTTSTTPETTSTPEPTTSTSTSTSSVPTTTSTSEAKSTVSTTSEVITSASPSATAGTGSGSGSATSDSNWVNMAQMMLAMGRLASVAHEGH